MTRRGRQGNAAEPCEPQSVLCVNTAMTPSDLRPIAHEALALAAMPLLKHQSAGRHRRRGGVAFTAMNIPGPGHNFVAVLGPAPPLADLLAEADDFFPGGRGSYGVLVEGGAGHPAEAELRRPGWSVAEDEPALV